MIFLLDTVGLNWSSFEATGGAGLSGRRCLHTAISVTGEDAGGNDDDGADTQQPQQGGPTTSKSLSAAASSSPSDAAASPPTESDNNTDVVAAPTAVASGVVAPDVRLWDPVVPAGGCGAPASARSAGSEKGGPAVVAGGGAAAKKKAGTKGGAAAAGKKAGSKEAVNKKGGIDTPAVNDSIDHGVVPDIDGGSPPVFERILIFGGVVDEAAVSGVSRWRRSSHTRQARATGDIAIG